MIVDTLDRIRENIRENNKINLPVLISELHSSISKLEAKEAEYKTMAEVIIDAVKKPTNNSPIDDFFEHKSKIEIVRLNVTQEIGNYSLGQANKEAVLELIDSAIAKEKKGKQAREEMLQYKSNFRIPSVLYLETQEELEIPYGMKIEFDAIAKNLGSKLLKKEIIEVNSHTDINIKSSRFEVRNLSPNEESTFNVRGQAVSTGTFEMTFSSRSNMDLEGNMTTSFTVIDKYGYLTQADSQSQLLLKSVRKYLDEIGLDDGSTDDETKGLHGLESKLSENHKKIQQAIQQANSKGRQIAVIDNKIGEILNEFSALNNIIKALSGTHLSPEQAGLLLFDSKEIMKTLESGKKAKFDSNVNQPEEESGYPRRRPDFVEDLANDPGFGNNRGKGKSKSDKDKE